MRLYIVCLIMNLVVCKKRNEYKSDKTSESSSVEEPEDIVLNLKGNLRKLFAVDLGLHSQGNNMICSPIAAMFPLAKLLLGASKQSKSEEELLAAVGLKNKKQINSTYTQIINELESLQGVKINLASKIYLSDEFELHEKFKNKSKSIFRSAIELVDTSRPEEVADRINRWVAVHTKDMIQNMISKYEIDQSPSLILVTAIYFKGFWREPFLPAVENLFYSPTGHKRVPMMSKKGKFNYVSSDALNAQIIELPYKNEQAAMIIVLPYEKKGLRILLRTLRLSQDLLTQALKEMVMSVVDVTIPKFKIETTIDLKSYYAKMEVNSTLSFEQSGLSKVVKHQIVYISSALQKALIEVTEEGTVAAAASLIVGFGSVLEFPIKFNADHPFLFYVRGHREQLFAGIVTSP